MDKATLFAFLTAGSAMLLACSPADIAKSLLSKGGGVNTAANLQLGKENHQTLGSVSNMDAGTIESMVVNNTSASMILLLMIVLVFAVVGWMLPTPSTLIKKWKNRGTR